MATARDDGAPPSPRADESATTTHSLNRAQIALIVVCVLHALSPLITRGLRSGFGDDETVYISQLDRWVPAGYFSAPRARGITFLTAPASLVSSSVTLMRVWLALVSGIGMYLSFIPWLRLRNNAVVPVAAALWACLWVNIYYGFEAMPNQYVAYGALAATGWLVLALREPTRARYLGYLAISLAVTALMRPSDSLFLVAGMAGCVILIRGLTLHRRGVVLAVMAAGVLAGFAQWIVEAYTTFGGPIARFHAASAENEGGGIHWSLGAQLRAVAGPILCRGNCHAAAPLDARLWWFALVPLLALGLWAARRERVPTMHLVATTAALAIAAEYVFAIGYAAPRFLVPTYLLLALPIAEGLVWLGARIAPGWRPIAIAAAAVIAIAQLNNQVHILTQLNRTVAISTIRARAIATSLNQAGVRGHCAILGDGGELVAFWARCADTTPAQLPGGQSSEPTAVISRQPVPGSTYVTGWPEYSFRGHGNHTRRWRVWISPSPAGKRKHPGLRPV